MTTLIACANGNLTSSSTWQTVDSTSFLNSENTSTALTTSTTRSSTFTPGAITIDGIAVKQASRNASPSGTISVRLDQGVTAVAGTTVTVNVADMVTCSTTDIEGGWHFFKFAAPVTLAAATAYSVGALTSQANMVNLWRDATTTNWSRALRTTTTAAPAAGDDMIITGEKTGAGAMTTRTVTMNSTAATDYGSNTLGAVTAALSISSGGTLIFGTTASTNYILQLSGALNVYAGGTLNVGTVATPIPRTSTATIQFDCSAARDFGMNVRNLSTFTCQGLSRTSGKDVWCALLTANAAANATSLTIDRDTGWLDNDVIGIAPTTYNTTAGESGTLNGNAGASTLTVDGFAGTGGGLLASHEGGGTDPYIVAEIVLLTRNVVIKGVNASFGSFVNLKQTATIDIDWTEFANLNGSAVNTPSIQVNATTGSTAISYSSMHDCVGFGLSMNLNTNDNFSFTGLGMYKASTTGPAFAMIATSGVNWSINGVWCLCGAGVSGSTPYMVDILDLGGTINDLRAVSSTLSGSLRLQDGTAGNFVPAGQVQNIVCHNGSFGTSGGYYSGYLDNLTYYRTTGSGLANDLNSGAGQFMTYTILRNPVIFEVGSTCLLLRSAGVMRLINPILAGGTTLAAANAFMNYVTGSVIVDGGSIGTVTGSRTAITTALVNINAGYNPAHQYFNNVTIGGSPVPIVASTNEQAKLNVDGAVHVMRKNGVATDNATYKMTGDILEDATFYKTAAPSVKLIPRFTVWTGQRHEGPPFLIAVNSGDVKTVSLYVYKHASYTGSQPRLILKASGAMGQNEDSVLATMAGGSGAWELLTSALPSAPVDGAYQILVDCDGTSAQAVWFDDLTVT